MKSRKVYVSVVAEIDEEGNKISNEDQIKILILINEFNMGVYRLYSYDRQWWGWSIFAYLYIKL